MPVQFLGNVESPASQGFADLASELGKGLGDFYTNYQAQKRLQSITENPTFKNAPLSEKMQKLQGLSGYGEAGEKALHRYLLTEQQAQQEKQQNILSKMFNNEKLNEQEKQLLSPEQRFKYEEIKNKREQQLKTQKVAGNIKKSLIRAGIDEEVADMWQDLYENAPVGGQSDIIKKINEELIRNKGGSAFEGNQSENKPLVDIEGLEEQPSKYDFPKMEEPKGFTSKEIASLKRDRERFNNPIYEKVSNRIQALEDESRDIELLNNLNESKKLPEGLGKWEVNWETGDPISPALVSPEAQLYIKTVYHMLKRAKDFFPGRVTNFDLENFKRTFPTLANSPDGRKLILKQLDLSNRIAYLKDETLKSAYNHYGRDASPQDVRKYADKNYSKLKPELENRLKNLDGMIKERVKQEKIKKPQEVQNNKNQDMVTPGWVKVEFNGDVGEVPENELEEALKKGAKRL